MKVASKLIFLFRDEQGFNSAIINALLPPAHTSLNRVESKFEVSLDKYEIGCCNATGDIVNFIDDKGAYQVSVLLMQNYNPPIVACAVNEVLASIMSGNSSVKPTIILPFFAPESKLNSEMLNTSTIDKKVKLYGTHIGPETDFTRAMIAGTHKPLSSFQVQFEPLACLVQFISVLNLPTVLLIGPRRGHPTKMNAEEQLQVLYKMGDFLANHVSLGFSKERLQLNPMKKLKEARDPWRELYG